MQPRTGTQSVDNISNVSLIVCALLTIGTMSLLSGCARPTRSLTPLPHVRVHGMDKWEKLFQNASPLWQGGDVAASVPLGSRRSLWLFGDTWIALQPGTGRSGAHMIANSVAIHKRRVLAPDSIEYRWKTAPNGGPDAVFSTELPDARLWPMSGIRLKESLVVFASAAVPAENKLGFTLTGNRMLVISNPDSPCAEWKTVEHAIPFCRFESDKSRALGNAVLMDKRSRRDVIYIYGYTDDRSLGGRRIILARASAAALLDADFSAWEFFNVSGWTSDIDQAGGLFDAAATEMSVHYLSAYKKYVAVYNVIGIAPEIVARFADAPEGPWSGSLPLYRCPEPESNRNYFCYAGKSHAELTRRARRLIVTYATNSWDFGDHFRDPELYWPQFVSVTLPTRLPGGL